MSNRIEWAFLTVLVLSTACGGERSETAGTGAASGSGGGAGAGMGGAEAGAGKVGDPCTGPAQCPGGGSGTTVCVSAWPEGYCAVSDCTQHGHDCPNDPGLGGTATTGGKCVLAPTATCLALCASDVDCRDGYECVPKPDAAGHATANVCFPKAASSGSGGMGSGGGMGGGGGGMMDGGM